MIARTTPIPERKRAVVIETELLREIRVIAGALDISVPEYIHDRLRPIVRKELPGVLEQLTAATK